MVMTIAEELQREGLAKGRVEGMAEGIAMGKIDSILNALAFRFGEIPAGIRKKLAGMRDAKRLEEVFRTAMSSPSLKEFQKAL